MTRSLPLRPVEVAALLRELRLQATKELWRGYS